MDILFFSCVLEKVSDYGGSFRINSEYLNFPENKNFFFLDSYPIASVGFRVF